MQFAKEVKCRTGGIGEGEIVKTNNTEQCRLKKGGKGKEGPKKNRKRRSTETFCLWGVWLLEDNLKKRREEKR